MPRRTSAYGIQPALFLYFFATNESPLPSILYFGVRANSLFLPTMASITACALRTEMPMPVAITKGMYRKVRHQLLGRSSFCATREELQIEHQHLEPALIETHNHGRQQHGGEQHHEGVADVGGEMEKGLGFDVPGRIGLHHTRQNFLRGLHQALGPACLLRLKPVHVNRQLGGALNVRKVEKFPATQLRAIGEIGILSECVVLPAPGVIDGLAAPNARGAVEIEKSAATRARTVLDNEMTVEQDCFHLREQRIVAI